MLLRSFKEREFDWDDGNLDKNWKKHGIMPKECEEVFRNSPLFTWHDVKHSQVEQRLAALGKTDENKRLCVIFTLRNEKIRVISARLMSKCERMIYAKVETDTEI